MNLGEPSRDARVHVKPKSYFIFSFDHGTLPELGEAALRRPRRRSSSPEARTTCAAPSCPYVSTPRRRTPGDGDEDGLLGLCLDGKRVADVGVPPMPEYYRHTLSAAEECVDA